MTSREITDCLMSEPYELSFDEIFDALVNLQRRELITINSFAKNKANMTVDVVLTFAMDWKYKL